MTQATTPMTDEQARQTANEHNMGLIATLDATSSRLVDKNGNELPGWSVTFIKAHCPRCGWPRLAKAEHSTYCPQCAFKVDALSHEGGV